MDNKTIYKKTLVFSLKRVFWDVVCIAVILGFATLGYFILSRMGQNGYIGLAIGAIVGLIPVIIILRFVSYSLKAGQIAMITRAVPTTSSKRAKRSYASASRRSRSTMRRRESSRVSSTR